MNFKTLADVRAYHANVAKRPHYRIALADYKGIRFQRLSPPIAERRIGYSTEYYRRKGHMILYVFHVHPKNTS